MANRNSESEDDFLRMQQEAIRRVREMQSRARATLENAGVHIEDGGSTGESVQSTAARPEQTASHPERTVSAGGGAAAPRQTANTSARNAAQNPPRSPAQNAAQNSSRSTESQTAHRPNEPHVYTQHVNHEYTRPQPNEPHEVHGERAPHKNEQPAALHMQGLNISLDTDQLMLMATLYLLVKDGADKWLILSLAYILLW